MSVERSGPPVPVYCAGAKVVGMHTAAPLVEGCGLNITLISHGDVMDLSVCVCPDNVPAVNDIATGIVDSVGILVAPHKNLQAGNAPQSSPR
jgi:diacylglycerol O-acyltransferase / wax synthase